jgi:hypothetical protein
MMVTASIHDLLCFSAMPRIEVVQEQTHLRHVYRICPIYIGNAIYFGNAKALRWAGSLAC